MLSCFSWVQLFVTPWTVTGSYRTDSSVHRILQTRILDGLPCLPPGDFPNPGIEPASPTAPALALQLAPSGKPTYICKYQYYCVRRGEKLMKTEKKYWERRKGNQENSILKPRKDNLKWESH